MSLPDWARTNLEPFTMTETGDYYKAKAGGGRRPGAAPEQWYLLKLCHGDVSQAQLVADMWTDINRHVPGSVPLAQTIIREGRLGMVFRYYPTQMYECMNKLKKPFDEGTQQLQSVWVARTVFDLHTRAECAHTRLHPKHFYLDSDGKFKLGHLSHCQSLSPDSSFSTLKAEDRYSVGLLMIYLMTNCAFDRLVVGSAAQALREYDANTVPGSLQDWRAIIVRLLDKANSSDRDLETVCKLEAMVPTSPTAQLTQAIIPSRLNRSSAPPKPCSNCPKSIAKDYVALSCSHIYCLSCTYNLCLPGADIPCKICGKITQIAEVIKRVPNADLRLELQLGLRR